MMSNFYRSAMRAHYLLPKSGSINPALDIYFIHSFVDLVNLGNIVKSIHSLGSLVDLARIMHARITPKPALIQRATRLPQGRYPSLGRGLDLVLLEA